MINFRPDTKVLKALKGQSLSTLLAYIADGTLPGNVTAHTVATLKLPQPHRSGPTLTEQIFALRQSYNKIKQELEWKPVAVILPVVHYQCTCCTKVSIAPQGGELLQYNHSSLGMKAVAIPQNYSTDALPKRLCISYRTGFGCQLCFEGAVS